MKRNKCDCFYDISDYFEELSEAVLENIKHDVAEYIKTFTKLVLKNIFHETIMTITGWEIRSVSFFIPDWKILNQGIWAVDRYCDLVLEQTFPTVSFSSFWVSLNEICPEISKLVVSRLSPFPVTYFCGFVFWLYSTIKCKWGNKLSAEH